MSSSRITRSTCFLPFLGGMYFSTLSVKNTVPTLSPLRIAENDTTALNSAASSTFCCDPLPNRSEGLTSTSVTTVSSRSSRYVLTNG